VEFAFDASSVVAVVFHSAPESLVKKYFT